MKTVIPVKSQRVEGADAKLLCTVGLQELGRSGAGVGLQSCAQSRPIDLLYVYICLCTELLSAEQPHAHLCPCAAFRGSPCAHLPELHRALLPPSTPHGIPLQLWGLPGPAAQFPPGDPCSTALPIHPLSPPPCPVCSLCTDGSEELQSSRRARDRCKLCAEHHQ